MRFLVDAQLPPALARWLVTQGHDAEHVADRDLASAKDLEIWELATTLGATLLTKDGDFAVMRTLREEGPAVLWIRLGNTRKRELLNWLDAILPSALEAVATGELLVELS